MAFAGVDRSSDRACRIHTCAILETISGLHLKVTGRTHCQDDPLMWYMFEAATLALEASVQVPLHEADSHPLTGHHLGR